MNKPNDNVNDKDSKSIIKMSQEEEREKYDAEIQRKLKEINERKAKNPEQFEGWRNLGVEPTGFGSAYSVKKDANGKVISVERHMTKKDKEDIEKARE